MNKFTKEMVNNYSDKENLNVLNEFDEIDRQIDLINEISGIEEVEPMTHCLDDFVYELREDVIEKSSSLEDILANSDQVIEREISVPKVVG